MDHDGREHGGTMTISMAERIFARICSDQDYADAVARGELDGPGIDPSLLSQLEWEVLIHDAGLLASETVGFSSASLRAATDGIAGDWTRPPSAHLHQSGQDADRTDGAPPPQA